MARSTAARLFLATCLLTSLATHAQTIEYNADMTAVVGISGLTIDGTVYDVDFTGRISHLDWASVLDVTTLADAETVLGTIAALFDSEGVSDLEFDLPSGNVFVQDRVTLWYGSNATSLIGVAITATGGWSTFIGGSNAPLNNAFGFAMDLNLSTTIPDTDADGIDDPLDNCLLVANTDQLDSDGDNYGNVCDADFDNSCIVNAVDLGLFRTAFFSSNPLYDLNGDGIVNIVDLGVLRTVFFAPPGPSGVTADCT